MRNRRSGDPRCSREYVDAYGGRNKKLKRLAQYQNFLSRVDNPEIFNCASGSENHPKCLYWESEIEVNVKGLDKRILRSIDDIELFLEDVRSILPGLDDIDILLGIPGGGLCPAPLISDLSYELSRMFQFFRAGILPYPGGYFDQLSVFMQAASVLSREENRLKNREIDDDRKK